jgi:alanyl-tRNA synthetase
MPTEKLYWDDPFALTFDTVGAVRSTWDGRPSIVLPQTRFYPEAGGQLGDTGSLDIGGARVRIEDTQIADDGLIHHVLEPAPTAEALEPWGTASVHGAVAKDRRLDHMAHHTAQHLLSSALADVARADTVSARLGRGSCTIDLDVPGTSDRDVARAEDLVNAVIRADVPIRAFFPTPDELASLKLRRTPKVTQGIRVIDIEGFDQSPCGGTHCTRTGQIGLVRVVGTEKYKGKIRLSFHAAARALSDMRAKDEVIAALMAELTCGAGDLGAGLGKLKADLRTSRESLGQARAELAGMVAEAALLAHPTSAEGTERRIVLVREHDDVPTLRVLAARLASRSDVVAICLSPSETPGDYAIVVQRGASSTFDCGGWLKNVAAAHGGRGDGRPERAEGRLPAAIASDARLRNA